MEEVIKILKDLKNEIKISLSAEHLVNNRVEKNQEMVNKIIEKKNKQIDALDEAIMSLEDLYEIEEEIVDIIIEEDKNNE